MAACRSQSLVQAQRRISEVRNGTDTEQQLRLYDGWAAEYEQDVTILLYQAPKLAASCLASVFQGPRADALVLDVACGTGLVAQELQAKGFCRFHGLDGSRGMLDHACRKGLYQELKQCMLGQEALPASSGFYNAVLMVGALSEGHVPTSVIPELLRVTKPGGFVCMTTRDDQSNLKYKRRMQKLLDDLERRGLWEKIRVQEVEQWERATAEQEATGGSGYISGVVYLYQKTPSVGF
ncbi:methyltransferase-like protein 27 [Eublepharis macularius]|uniref:Methyltransferase-like protein 27 n=1 Tax=Eublepharis macularius TaxID=481883 RepID=A0AA97KLW3_EUBMA|nr:methyltransferase-like protein 27 [Eublepharis macularius]